MNKVSHIGTIRERNRVIMQQVCEVTGITELEYSNLLLDEGINWIQRNMYNDPEVIALLTQEEYFWRWFKTQYFNLDNNYLSEMVICILFGNSKAFLKAEYQMWHRHANFGFPSGPEWDRVLKGLMQKAANQTKESTLK